jgi:hypothetical protein
MHTIISAFLCLPLLHQRHIAEPHEGATTDTRNGQQSNIHHFTLIGTLISMPRRIYDTNDPKQPSSITQRQKLSVTD